ncbi:hypothetical protein M413DRAFT_30734 [Hebeloma cylindrosporum]|uniref:F-box domain-containing protein n=1 Tax=Hebeloma cylindrosporum TaxID=76867 RepID=A0A0C2Y9W8_HEBCY|nr:hypothetical protein M413DRAFT_30734 [Hebeloma cylindrosporum h7]
MSRTTLPLDILIFIIDLLARGDRDVNTIQILSQTCKFMVPLCRKHLFSSLDLRSMFRAERFSDLLSKNPDIACYLRILNFYVDTPIADHERDILEILKNKCTNLRSITLSSTGNWNDLPESIRSCLIFLIQLPTITRLSIGSFKTFPANELSRCSNLIHLQLHSWLQMAPPKANQIMSHSKIPTPASLTVDSRTYGGLAILLDSASSHAGGPIVDFSHLQGASFMADSPGDISHINKLLEVTTGLAHLDLDLVRPVQLTGLGASLASNAYRSLKYMNLRIFAYSKEEEEDSFYPLCGLNRELRSLAGNNVLEELELDVFAQSKPYQRDPSEDWSAFDSVLTESGMFPLLHQVSVEISWSTERFGSHEQHLIGCEFPRLMESRVVVRGIFPFC